MNQINFKLFIKCVALLFTLISSKLSHKDFLESIKHLSSEKQFSLWAFYHGKEYDTNEIEANKRLQIFTSNLEFIKKENSKNLGYTLGLGPFTDLTFEEFSSIFRKSDVILKKNEGIYNDDVNPNPKPTKDWSDHFVVKDYKNCDSGNEAALSLIEFQLRQKYNDITELSSQNWVDCISGCQYFGFNNLLKSLKETGAYPLEEYPFTGKLGVCKANERYDTANKCDKTDPYVVFDNEKLICNFMDDYKNGSKVCKLTEYESILNKSPYATVILITPEVQHYTFGVLEVNCKTGNNRDKTEVIGVVTAMDKESAKILLPFGNSYGERGFLRMKRQTKSKSVHDRLCGPEGYAYTISEVKKVENRTPIQ